MSVSFQPSNKTPLNRFHPGVTQDILLSGAAQIAQRLHTLSSTLGPKSESKHFYTRVRAKASDSIRKKIFRKQRGIDSPTTKPDYSFRDLTDLVGFRIVTLYDDDLKESIDYILELIVAGQHLPDPLFTPGFVWDVFHETRFIAREDKEQDPYVKCLKHLKSRVAADCDNDKEIKDDDGNIIYEKHKQETILIDNVNCFKETGRGTRYSSAHMIFNATAYIGNYVVIIPVEFQFRTAAEDIWAELNHKLVYKIDTAFAWSQGYDVLRTKLNEISGTLKTLIDALPATIDAFYDSSQVASTAIDKENFWAPKNQLYPHSLVISLFSIIGDRRQWEVNEDKISVIDTISATEVLPPPVVGAFTEYGELIEELKSQHKAVSVLKLSYRSAIHDSKDVYTRLLNEAIKKRQQVTDDAITVLEKIKPLVKSHIVASEERLNVERASLCDLEQIRLRVLSSAYFKEEFIEPNETLTETAKNEKAVKKQNELLALYRQLCEYLERPLSVRPMCMIMFFKYLISTQLDSPAQETLMKKNLINSYDFLDGDMTIPSWSIYRVLLPRHLGLVRLAEAQAMLSLLDGCPTSINSMVILKGDIISKLNEAMGYALRAAQEHQKAHDEKTDIPYKHRGDIILGFDPNEELLEYANIINIYGLHELYLPETSLSERLLPARRKDVKSALNGLLSSPWDSNDDAALKNLTDDVAGLKELQRKARVIIDNIDRLGSLH